jgi:site-specific DNA recombinase
MECYNNGIVNPCMLPYVIYARKSTESEDRQVVSIESQVNELRLLAARQSIQVAEVLTESHSAKRPGRPVFDEMLRRIHRGQVRGILCWKMDRLARNHLDHGAILQALADGLLERIVTTDRPYTGNGTDRFIGNFELGMATKYSDDLSQNVRRGNRVRLEQGWITHNPPLGYLIDKDTKTIVKDPDRFELVRRMWDLLLTGTMRPEVILTIANKEWHFRTRQFKRAGGNPLSRTTLYNIFANPFYTGVIRLRSGQTYVGAHDAMVSQAEFDRVQEILGRTGRERPKLHAFAFTGILQCGHCGGAITAEEHVKKSGRRYVYYHCSRRRAGVVCREPMISESELIAQLSRELERLRMPEAVHSWLCREALAQTESEQERENQVHRTIQQALDGLGREEGNLLDLRTRDLITDDVFLTKRRHLQERRTSLQNRLRSDERRSSTGDALVKAFTFAARAQEVFETGTAVQKRMILEAAGSNHTLKARRVALSLDKPLDRVAEAGGLSNWSGLLDDVRTWILENGPLFGIPDLARAVNQRADAPAA